MADATGRRTVVFAESGSVRSSAYTFSKSGGQGGRWESRWSGVRTEILAASDRRFTWRDGLDEPAWNAIARVDGADPGAAIDTPFPGRPFDGEHGEEEVAVRRLVDAASAAGRFRTVEAEVRRSRRDVLVCRSDSDPVTRREEAVRWRLRIVPDAPGVYHEWTEAVLPEVPEAWAISAAESVLDRSTGILPSGSPVLVRLDPSASAVWLHEVVGHAAEADFGPFDPFAGTDAFPLEIWSLPLFPGSTDDEGFPERRFRILGPSVGRTGRLRDARHAGVEPAVSNGNGRRQDYRHPVLPRIGAIVAERVAGVPTLDVGAGRRILHVQSILAGHIDPRSLRVCLDLGRAEWRDGAERVALPAGLRLVGTLPAALDGIVAVGAEEASDDRTAWYRRLCLKRGQVVETANFCPSLLLRGFEIA